VTRVQEQRYDARFVCPAMFIPCLGARDEDTAKKLAAAFRRGGLARSGPCGGGQSRMKPAGARETAGGSPLSKTDLKSQE